MTATNNITGDRLVSSTSDAYRDNYDSIFGKDKVKDKPKNTDKTKSTDLDKFKDLFSKSKIPFVEEEFKEELWITLEVDNKSTVKGYGGFYSCYIFDKEGNFKYIGIWE